jgi:hypothetical protein
MQKFEKHGYCFHDILRWKIWNHPDVEFWYKQNLFIVAHDSILFASEKHGFLSADYDLIHPDCFKYKVDCIADIENGKRGIFFYFSRLFKSVANRSYKKWRH